MKKEVKRVKGNGGNRRLRGVVTVIIGGVLIWLAGGCMLYFIFTYLAGVLGVR